MKGLKYDKYSKFKKEYYNNLVKEKEASNSENESLRKKIDDEYLNLNGHITDQNKALDELLNFGLKYIKEEIHNRIWTFFGWMKYIIKKLT